MARKNRKKGRKKGSAIPALIMLAVLFVGLGLAYVWLDYVSEELGAEIAVLEDRNDVLEKQHTNERCRWVQLKSPVNLDRHLRVCGLQMRVPRCDQVIRFYEVPREMNMEVAAADDSSRYAQLQRTGINE